MSTIQLLFPTMIMIMFPTTIWIHLDQLLNSHWTLEKKQVLIEHPMSP